jgi:hypothetical protein
MVPIKGSNYGSDGNYANTDQPYHFILLRSDYIKRWREGQCHEAPMIFLSITDCEDKIVTIFIPDGQHLRKMYDVAMTSMKYGLFFPFFFFFWKASSVRWWCMCRGTTGCRVRWYRILVTLKRVYQWKLYQYIYHELTLYNPRLPYGNN